MARITAHELAFAFETVLLKRFRAVRMPRAKAVATELSEDLMREVPTEAFDIKPSWERGVMFLHGEVTEEYVREMQEEILAIHFNVKSGIPITLYLSSIGGTIDSGLALFSTIQEVRRTGRKVNCHVQGVAMSMGSILVQACDDRSIEPYAAMMLHEASDTITGKTLDLEDAVAFQKRWDGILTLLYASRSGKPVEYWRERMARRDWYLTAHEAVREGLVDRVRPTPAFKGKKKSTPKVDGK